jgi:hypothetical protein
MESLGFRKNLITGLNLTPGDNHLNTQLQVGTSTETVEVSSAPGDLNTTSASVAGKMLSGVANRPHVATGFGAGTAGGAFRAGVPVATPPPASLEEARALGQAAATGQDLGDLFEYKLKDHVTLKKKSVRSRAHRADRD